MPAARASGEDVAFSSTAGDRMWASASARRVSAAPSVNAVDLPSSGRNQQAALTVEGDRPDVLLVRIEEGRGFARGVDGVDPSIRRGRDVDPAVRTEGHGMDLELGCVVEEGAFAGLDPEDLPLVPGSGVEHALGTHGQGPDVRGLGVVEEARRGARRTCLFRVHGDALRLAVQEIARSSILQ
jgi:hypothetical protein